MTVLGEPWFCNHCGSLIYNRRYVDGAFYPVEGAPPAHYISTTYPRVCSTCHFMHSLIDTKPYWMNLHEKTRERDEKIKRLRPGSDYFA